MITTTEGPVWVELLQSIKPFLASTSVLWDKNSLDIMACKTFGSIEEQFDNRETHTNLCTIYCSWMNGFSTLISFQSHSIISWYAKDITRKLLRNELQIGLENLVRVKAYKCAVQDQDCYLLLYNTQKISAHVWQSGGYFQSIRSTLLNALTNGKSDKQNCINK
jgi:hypothetical protein